VAVVIAVAVADDNQGLSGIFCHGCWLVQERRLPYGPFPVRKERGFLSGGEACVLGLDVDL
jgi:hypothetical protein